MSPSEADAGVPAGDPAGALGESIRFHLARWLPLVGAAVVGYVLFPPPAVVITALPSAGQVADRTVVAPFSFETPKSSEEITSEGESRAFSVRPVYRYSPTAYDSALAKARSFFAELERAEQQGPDLLRAVAATRVSLGAAETEYLAVEEQRRRVAGGGHPLPGGDALPRRRGRRRAARRAEPPGEPPAGRGRTGGAARFDPVLRRPDGAGGGRRQRGRRSRRPARGAAAGRRRSTIPRSCPTSRSPPSRREQLRASVDPVKYYVSAGERITTAGQPVTEVGRAKLAALQVQIGKRGSGHPFLRGAAGALLYNAVVMAAFWLLLLFYRRETYDKLREVMFFGVLFSLVLLLTAGLDRAFPGRPELVPIPFAAIVVTLLYNGRVGMVAALILADPARRPVGPAGELDPASSAW